MTIRIPPEAGDEARLAALASYAVLDTPAEPGFDDIVHLACRLCSAPVALVSLVAGDRQWFKARVGFPPCETDLNSSVCAHALARPDDLLVIPDLAADPRTAANPLVTGEPFIRFYAGAPLVTPEGHTLGSLCVIDTKPRPGGLIGSQADDLRALARQVMAQLELRRAVAARDAARAAETEAQGEVLAGAQRQRAIFDSTTQFAIVVTDREGLVTDWNAGAERTLGWSAEEMVGRSAERFFTLEDRAAGQIEAEMRGALERGRADDERWHLRRDGTRFWASGEMMPLRDAAGEHRGYVKVLRDRTGQRLAEERLRVADERLQLALAASGVVGLWDWMVDTDLLHGDANFARLYGLDPATTAAGITMEQYQEHVVAEDVDGLRARIRDTFERGADFLVEYRLAIPGQPLRWVECKGRLIHDGAGRPVRFSGTAIDLTERKQAEAALKESQAALALERGLLGTVLDQAPVGIALAFADGRASFNARARQMLGHGPGEGDARYAAYHAVHPDGRRYRPEEYPTLRALRAGEVVRAEPMHYRDAGGEERRWQISSAPIRDGEGDIIAAVSLFEDVEDQRRAAEALRESEAHWRGLFERLSEGFIVGEVIRGEDGRVADWRYVEVNSAWGELVGIDPTTATGRTIREVFPSIEDEWVTEFAGVVDTGEAIAFTRQVGTLHRWYEGRAFPLERERFGVLFLEVTDRLEVETRLRQAQEAGGVGLFAVDVADNVLVPTPEFCRLYGLPVRDHYPASVFESCVLPEDAHLVSSRESRARGEPLRAVEYRIRRVDTGEVRWIARTGEVEFDAAGRAVRFLGVSRDVTSAKLAAERLRANEALLRRSTERIQLALEAGAIIGTWFWDIQADRFTVDEAFARAFGLDPALGQEGLSLDQVVATVHPDDQAGLAAAIEGAIARGGRYAHQYRTRRLDGNYYWLEANGHVEHAPDGTPLRFPGVLIDIEDRRRTELRRNALLALGDRLRDLGTVRDMTMAACETLGVALGVELVGYGDVDPRRETIAIERDWTAGGVASLAGTLHFRDFGSYIDDLKAGETVVVADGRTDPRTRGTAAALEGIGIRALVNAPVFERGAFVGLLYVCTGQVRPWSDEDVAFVQDVASRVRLATARVRAEELQATLNGELAHRLKNTLAVVQSIVSQTLRSVPERGPVDTLAQRISALGGAHDVLLRRSWGSAPLRAAAEAVLGSLGLLARCDLDGPAVDLGPKATMSLSLVLHEMATNAAKYGALSNDTGRVALAWGVDASGDRETLVLDWVETGGPPAREPTRRGFGSRLVRTGLIGQGGVDLHYPPEGFRAHMTAPLDDARKA